MRQADADWRVAYFGGTVHSRTVTIPGADKVGIKGIAHNRTADERHWSQIRTFFNKIFR
jgi:hypothetical protein